MPLVPNTRGAVRGWVQSLRRMKNVWFLDVNDGSSVDPVAVVAPPQPQPVHTGAAVEATGRVVAGRGKQSVELQTDTLRVLGPATADFPLQKKYHSPEFLRQLPQFRWRTRHNAQLLRARSWALHELSSFFHDQGIFEVHAPLITSSDCEGAGEVFRLHTDLFDTDAYLTVSTQLHLEVLAAALGNVYTITPAFRAERSDTNRHLAEFWLVEAELSFCSRENLLQLTEKLLRCLVPRDAVANELLNSKRDSADQVTMQRRWETLRGKWAQISYSDALSELNASKLAPPLVWGDVLTSEHEKALATHITRAPTFVTDYPLAQKPFYMSRSSESTADCFDLILPELGEVVGGSMRESDAGALAANISARKMNLEQLQWYVDLRRQGSAPHGGFGVGFDRLLMYMHNVANIRDVVTFPRYPGHLPC